jgi:hypothetical protein
MTARFRYMTATFFITKKSTSIRLISPYKYQRPTSPATLSAKQNLQNPENLPAEVVFQKQHHSMPYVVPVRRQSFYSRATCGQGSTLFQPQLHPPIGRYTSA